MVLSVVFRRLMPVMGRMQSMRVRDMGVMASFLVIARLVVPLRDDGAPRSHDVRLRFHGDCRPCGTSRSC